jgi:probable rRNA maturation factor
VRIQIQRAPGLGALPRGTRWRAWAQAAGLAGRGALTVRLTGVRESERLNERYRGKPGPTNVLAFPAAAPDELGDLVICLPQVRAEARLQGKRPIHHLAHLFVHGALHLLGESHETPATAAKMERREVRILAGLGIGDPYGPLMRNRSRQPRRTT